MNNDWIVPRTTLARLALWQKEHVTEDLGRVRKDMAKRVEETVFDLVNVFVRPVLTRVLVGIPETLRVPS